MTRCFSVLMLIWPLSAAAGNVTQVSVLDEEFRPIRTLQSASDLTAFEQLWLEREKQGPDVAMRAVYKIDIESAGRSDRWLYDPAGLVRRLTKRKSPVYRLPSASAFNQLLAIEPK